MSIDKMLEKHWRSYDEDAWSNILEKQKVDHILFGIKHSLLESIDPKMKLSDIRNHNSRRIIRSLKANSESEENAKQWNVSSITIAELVAECSAQEIYMHGIAKAFDLTEKESLDLSNDTWWAIVLTTWFSLGIFWLLKNPWPKIPRRYEWIPILSRREISDKLKTWLVGELEVWKKFIVTAPHSEETYYFGSKIVKMFYMPLNRPPDLDGDDLSLMITPDTLWPKWIQ